MIYGIGIDLAETGRFASFLDRHADLSKIYGERELEMLKSMNRPESYAANFCAKEAFSKALGTGVRGFRLFEAEVLRDGLGKPFFLLSGKAKEIAGARGLTFFVSLTHTKISVAAVVVAEKTFPGTGSREEDAARNG